MPHRLRKIVSTCGTPFMGRRRKRHSLATTSAQYRMCWPIFLFGRQRFCLFLSTRRDPIFLLCSTCEDYFLRVSADSFPIIDGFACLPDHQWASLLDCFSSTCLLWLNRLISTRQSIKGMRDRQLKHDLSDDNNNTNDGKQSKTDSAQEKTSTQGDVFASSYQCH